MNSPPNAFPTAVVRVVLALAILWLLLMSGCARLPSTGVTSIKAPTFGALEGYLLSHTADVEQFRLRGPFEVTTHNDFALQISPGERITADLYLSAPAQKAPLVIIMHGYDNSKDDHAYQALHLATWGLHSLAVQLPNKGAWIGNGRTLARLVAAIHRRPDLVDTRIDPDKIILVGHSFGASSVAIALAEGAPAAGGILLDPAAVGRGLPGYLGRINKPIMVLGADEDVFTARGRGYFYRFVRTGIGEVSIGGAAHEDAQFSLEPANGGGDGELAPTEKHQITFVAALTSAAFSLAATGRFDYAWTSFDDAIKSGRLINPRKK